MRVTDVSIYSNNIEAINFSVRSADPKSQYIVRNMVGLDAEEIIPKFYGMGLYTKPKYYDFNLKSRDIVIRLVLNPRFQLDESFSDIRDALYRAISSSRTGLVALHFNAGGTTVARIFGFITKFEAAYFTNLPEAQLTITCNDPMFRAINPIYYNISDIKTVNPVVIADNLSTAPHGFNMQVTFKAASPSFTVQDASLNPEWVFKVTPNGGFLSGDILYFSSEYSNKYLYMVRSGVTTYLLDKIVSGSIWPIVFPGGNNLYFMEIPSFNWNALSYYPAYWGV